MIIQLDRKEFYDVLSVVNKLTKTIGVASIYLLVSNILNSNLDKESYYCRLVLLGYTGSFFSHELRGVANIDELVTNKDSTYRNIIIEFKCGLKATKNLFLVENVPLCKYVSIFTVDNTASEGSAGLSDRSSSYTEIKLSTVCTNHRLDTYNLPKVSPERLYKSVPSGVYAVARSYFYSPPNTVNRISEVFSAFKHSTVFSGSYCKFFDFVSLHTEPSAGNELCSFRFTNHVMSKIDKFSIGYKKIQRYEKSSRLFFDMLPESSTDPSTHISIQALIGDFYIYKTEVPTRYSSNINEPIFMFMVNSSFCTFSEFVKIFVDVECILYKSKLPNDANFVKTQGNGALTVTNKYGDVLIMELHSKKTSITSSILADIRENAAFYVELSENHLAVWKSALNSLSLGINDTTITFLSCNGVTTCATITIQISKQSSKANDSKLENNIVYLPVLKYGGALDNVDLEENSFNARLFRGFLNNVILENTTTVLVINTSGNLLSSTYLKVDSYNSLPKSESANILSDYGVRAKGDFQVLAQYITKRK